MAGTPDRRVLDSGIEVKPLYRAADAPRPQLALLEFGERDQVAARELVPARAGHGGGSEHHHAGDEEARATLLDAEELVASVALASASSVVRAAGELGAGVTAKDLILATIGQMGVEGAVGHVVEYAGAAVSTSRSKNTPLGACAGNDSL